jgi:hypothetical protein
MEPDSNSLRDRLLSQSPLPGDLAGYRQQVASLIDSNQKRLRRERIVTTAFWIFCAVSATAWLWFDAGSAHFPRGPFLACIFFIWGGVELVKHHINTARVDLLKEMKQMQVQMFALQAQIPKVQ